MRVGSGYFAALLAGMVCLTFGGTGQPAAGQGFAGAIAPAGMEGEGVAGSTPESRFYAEGTKAIDEGRWVDAEGIFTKIASQRNGHADGALYWKAYAENKLGQTKPALDTCYVLGQNYPNSSWIHECGALEIEIHARSGKPAEPKAGDDDDLKLLALNSLIKTDAQRALAQVQEILNGDASEKLKKEALFILGNFHTDTIYDEIVRISYVEGDVRVARGKDMERITGASWEKAVADLPLETGFSLVTGNGRAEIEFEDASTLYVAENTVLMFNDLHTTRGIPHTEVALLAGTVSAHILGPQEGSFLLRTPTDDRYLTSNSGNGFQRITSYLDGVAVTTPEDGAANLESAAEKTLASGRTVFYRGGYRFNAPAAYKPNAFADWDRWVADRIAQRTAAMTEVMIASGLTAPIPGLEELKGQGTFFDCAPYGTCWEPANGDDRQQADNAAQIDAKTTAVVEGQQPATKSKTAGTAQTPEQVDEAIFPCSPLGIRSLLARDPATGKTILRNPALEPIAVPYRWPVCHAGSWIHARHRYVWVVGKRRNHIQAVRWVKSGRTLALVPLHPYDVLGRPPMNVKEDVFAVRNRDGFSIERTRLDAAIPIETLKAPPKEFHDAYQPMLSAADVPRMEAHSVKESAGVGNGGVQRTAGVPLSFDRKTESFLMARQGMQGDRNVSTMMPISNRGGTLQGRGSSYSGGSSRGGSGSSSGSRSGGGGGGSSSAGSHGGGVGTTSTSSVSTPSTASTSAASATAASSSGTHH